MKNNNVHRGVHCDVSCLVQSASGLVGKKKNFTKSTRLLPRPDNFFCLFCQPVSKRRTRDGRYYLRGDYYILSLRSLREVQ